MFALLPLWVMAQEKIMVIADPHVLAKSLIEEGDAFDSMMVKQRKMIDLSEPIWNALMDTAMKYKPELVLIPGDLTKDSEKASHAIVVNGLRRLEEAGIKTLVIPGNHDIGGNAKAYRGVVEEETESLKNTYGSRRTLEYTCDKHSYKNTNQRVSKRSKYSCKSRIVTKR